MTPRNTRTGGVLELMVLPALDQGGYTHKVQVNIGKRLGLGRHMVDVVAEKDGHSILVSMKWQQVSGTAEQKVPYEVICLLGKTNRSRPSPKRCGRGMPELTLLTSAKPRSCTAAGVTRPRDLTDDRQISLMFLDPGFPSSRR